METMMMIIKTAQKMWGNVGGCRKKKEGMEKEESKELFRKKREKERIGDKWSLEMVLTLSLSPSLLLFPPRPVYFLFLSYFFFLRLL